MDKYDKIPVVDVHKDNLSEVWPGLISNINRASFIALDTELSGLGDRKKLLTKFIEDRYHNLVHIAKSRAILAFGISCFEEHSSGIVSTGTPEPEDNTEKVSSSCKKGTLYRVHTYNLSVLCNEEFVVEPASLQFLIQHGFDFNKQFSKGISYHKGHDKEHCDYTSLSVRNLFAHILLSNNPVVVHNGLLDLVFLYHNFYSTLPEKLEVFTSDVHCMFSGGVLDTKYIADYKFREPASYLSYIFRKSQRYNNCKDLLQRCITVEFPEQAADRQWIEYLPCHEQAKDSDETGIQICDLYAVHGFCRRGTDCHLSHDIDHILDKQDQKETLKKKRKRRKRSKANNEGNSSSPVLKKQDMMYFTMEQKDPGNAISNEEQLCVDDEMSLKQEDPMAGETIVTNRDLRQLSVMNTDITTGGPRQLSEANPAFSTNGDTRQLSATNRNVTTGGHRAGVDAFMTGYCLATYLVQGQCCNIKDGDWVNKISLSGKELPLTLACSHFAKPSVSHTRKIESLKAKFCTQL